MRSEKSEAADAFHSGLTGALRGSRNVPAVQQSLVGRLRPREVRMSSCRRRRGVGPCVVTKGPGPQ